MKSQAQEELMHAMKLYDYVVERGGRVTLKGIDGPQTSWKNPVALVGHVYEHEQHVTALINGLMDLAIKEKDHATVNFLQWFVKEQVEEEASADEILKKLRLAGDKGNALFMIDKELAARVPLFTFPVTP
jgi:ferritin